MPLTHWKYFYGKLPVSILGSDDDNGQTYGLQPRYLMADKVFDLFRHFQDYPVLQPSIGRIENGKVLLFDGQHKIAALLWAGRRDFECKIYIDPDVRVLNQANISAHDKFAQTRFFSSIMVLKLGKQFGKDFETYKNDESIAKKSEKGFVDYMYSNGALTKADVNSKFRSYLYNSILENDENKWKPLVATGNRGNKAQPITMDMLKKSIFAKFLYLEPLDDDILSDDYKRDDEANNVIRMMNIIYGYTLKDWKSNATENDDTQRKLSRIFASKSIIAWCEIFKDAVAAKPILDITDSDDREKIFYRNLGEEEFKRVDFVIQRLAAWSQWNTPKGSEIDSMLSNPKDTLKKLFKNKGLTTGYLLGADE